MSCFVSVKGSCRRRMISRDSSTLTAWANTVAMAAPATPIPKPPTISKSPAILNTQAMLTVIRGIWESPSPRKMLPRML